jgi:calcium-dependent protein kinase
VFAAQDSVLNVPVALKIVDRTKLTTPTELERARREAVLLRGLSHRHVVELLDFFEDERYLYLSLALATDGDLETLLGCRTLTEQSTRNLAAQIFCGLAFVHTQRVILCDIKPKNILIFGNTVKLCDFSLAEVLTDVPFTGLRGSSGYFSPEQLRAEKTYNAKIDVFAAGVVLFTVLAGYEPVYPASQAEKLTPYGDVKVDFSAEIWTLVTHEMIDFLAKCLAGTSEARLSSSQALKHPWIRRKEFPTVEKYPDPSPDSSITFCLE